MLASPIELPAIGLYQGQPPPSGNVIFQGRDKAPKTVPAIQSADCKDKMRAQIAANSGRFALNWEISVCAGLRGGAGRTRTSNQMVMSVPSSRQLGPSYFSGTSRCQWQRDQQGRQSKRVVDASPRNRYLTDFDVLSRRPWDIPTVDSFFYESSQG